jgi:hypothetical protein
MDVKVSMCLFVIAYDLFFLGCIHITYYTADSPLNLKTRFLFPHYQYLL